MPAWDSSHDVRGPPMPDPSLRQAAPGVLAGGTLQPWAAALAMWVGV